ncbi:MAG: hypothetical protein BGP12_21755 [Rhodospirillales bacterium 70-18]|nr:trypsin-like peptidase domain-containing protein [Rhodospirillales bacterium]OJY70371.1 MAG: hypothetical protein BGP12_21755 [Rhodospirillales bacterium 70-18]
MPRAPAPRHRLFLAAVLLAVAAGPALAQQRPAGTRPTSTGSGFLVGDTWALTNHHVVAGCTRIVVRNDRRQTATATVQADDPARDLALLAVPPGAGTPLVFRDGPPVERGEQVVTYGFPLYGLLTSGPTLTTGDVSALSGIGDNPLHLQISAPVQPGNSGGPVMDRNGHVIGVVVSKLNALRVSKLTGGDVPQNVNFAIKGTEAAAFLAAHGVAPKLAASTGAELRPAQVGELANAGTLFVECFGGPRHEPAAAPTSGPTATRKAQDDPSFRLVNRADQPIKELFATLSGSRTWGRNRLVGSVVAPGAAHVVRLPRGGGCVYDLRVVYADGRGRERKNVNLCAVTDVPAS